MGRRSSSGGILRLLELVEAHPAEIAYDFRSRFNLSYTDIGVKVGWLEAVYLVAVLMKDPSSWLQAAVSEWEFPVSREWIVAVQTFDLHAAVNSKKPKPYPTPWPNANTKKLGSKNQSRNDVLTALERMNPKENDG